MGDLRGKRGILLNRKEKCGVKCDGTQINPYLCGRKRNLALEVPDS